MQWIWNNHNYVSTYFFSPSNNNNFNIGKKTASHFFLLSHFMVKLFFFVRFLTWTNVSAYYLKKKIFFSEYLTSIIINAVNQRFCCMQYASRSSIYDEHFICVYLYAFFQAFRSIYGGGHAVSAFEKHLCIWQFLFCCR